MPIYEYACTHCGHTFEQIQKMQDPPLSHCPLCEKNTAIRQISAAGFQLKGTGWYVTDFKNGGQKAPAKQEKAAEPVASVKSESKTDK